MKGLAKHFKDGGCPNDPGREKENLTFTLVDHLDTTQEELDAANHTGGVQCKCTICGKLKTLEDKFGELVEYFIKMPCFVFVSAM